MAVIDLRRRLFRFARIVGKSIAILLIGCALFVGAFYVYSQLPAFQPDVHCYYFHVYFKGPKAKRFISVITERIKKRGEPYFIRNDRVFTTGDGIYYEQMDKIIMYHVRPEWFSDPPTFENARVKAIVEDWKYLSTGDDEKAWCRVVEAAISKNGIDAQARRDHPDIWPPDRFPVPPERQ